MNRLSSNIVIDKLIFKGIVSFESESSWDNFTDTCTIEIPKKIKWKGAELRNVIKRMQTVTVNLGYNDINNTVFTGYVREVNAGIPMKIMCEDAMFLLKQTSLTKSYAKVSLEQLIKDIAPGIEFKTENIELGKIRINKASAAKVFDMLKSDYGIPAFFRNNILYAGLKYWPEYAKTHSFEFNKNIIDSDLTFRNKADIKVKVTAISITENSKIEYNTGDDEGEQHTFYWYDKSESTLKQLADAEIEKLKYDGYRGSFTTFGWPYVQHGDVVKLTDKTYNREGSYMVKSVKRGFGNNGYRQIIELDRTA